MDEAGLIRQQHDIEHAHLKEAVQRLAALETSGIKTPEITKSYKDYIIRYIRIALSRYEAMARQLARKAALAPQDRAALEDSSQLKRASEVELARLEQSREASGPARAALEMSDRMRALVIPLVAQHFTISDWRQSARLDADSMLQERRCFAQLMALRRDGIGATPA